MFSRKKKAQSKAKTTDKSKGKSSNDLGNFVFGLDGQQNQIDDDDDLEAELLALTGGKGRSRRDHDDDSDLEAELLNLVGGNRKKMKKTSKTAISKVEDLKQTKEPGLEPQKSVEDDDVDENDPELLQELLELNMDEGTEESEEDTSEADPENQESDILTTLKERLEMYVLAEGKATEAKESARARRFKRGIKVLEDLMKQAENGQPVLASDIPPLIATGQKRSVDSGGSAELQVTAPGAKSSVDSGSSAQLQVLVESQQTIRHPSVELVVPPDRTSDVRIDSNDPQSDTNSVKMSFEAFQLEVLGPEDGDSVPRPSKSKHVNIAVEGTQSPPPGPSEVEGVAKEVEEAERPLLRLLKSRREDYKSSAIAAKKRNELALALQQVKTVKALDQMIAAAEKNLEVDENSIPPPPRAELNLAPPDAGKTAWQYDMPNTVLEALEQRLKIYKGLLAEAESRSDSLATRTNTKIVRLYTDVIKLHKQGKALPLERLPTPPGCPPIPITFQL